MIICRPFTKGLPIFWMETRFCSDALKETSFLMHDVELPGKDTKGEYKNNTVGRLNSING